MRLVMLGPPGAGKGTQAQVLQSRYGVAHLSTGDILRKHRVDGTDLGREAQSYMDRGALVPDPLILAMVEVELATKQQFILDGFPRTIPQAHGFEALLTKLHLSLDAVLLFNAERSALIARLSARWTNPRNGKIYNTLSNPPRLAGVDDEDGLPLVQRPDDSPETAAKRLDVYDQETAPLIGYYRAQGLLREIDALRSIADVTQEIAQNFNTAAVGDASV